RHASRAIYLGMSDIALLQHIVTEQMKLIAQLRAEISQLRAAIAQSPDAMRRLRKIYTCVIRDPSQSRRSGAHNSACAGGRTSRCLASDPRKSGIASSKPRPKLFTRFAILIPPHSSVLLDTVHGQRPRIFLRIQHGRSEGGEETTRRAGVSGHPEA